MTTRLFYFLCLLTATHLIVFEGGRTYERIYLARQVVTVGKATIESARKAWHERNEAR